MEDKVVYPDNIAYDKQTASDIKEKSFGNVAVKTGGNIFMLFLKIIFGALKTFFKFFFALGFLAKILFMLILLFFMIISFIFGYFIGRNNYDQKIKTQLEEAQSKLENIEKEIKN